MSSKNNQSGRNSKSGMRIVTIGRQCGSGGHTIGTLVAKALDVPFFDKRLLEMVAERSGMTEETVARQDLDSSIPLSLLTGIMSGYNTTSKIGFSLPTLNISDEVFSVEAHLIRELAEQEPCVIVGRCSDYLLREQDDCLHVFIHGRFEDRVERVIREHRVPPEEAEAHVINRDRKRGKHYRHITDRTWGMAENYSLALDSSVFGIERCVEMIVRATQTKH